MTNYTATFRGRVYKTSAPVFWISAVIIVLVAAAVISCVFKGWGNISELYTGYRWLGYIVVLTTVEIGINGVDYAIIPGRAGKWWRWATTAAGLLAAFAL